MSSGVATGAGQTYSRAMTVLRMDNVLIVVDDLEAAKAFFIELGLKLEGETTVEGPSVGKPDRARGCPSAIASMMRTPTGRALSWTSSTRRNAIRFGPVDAPVNTLGIRRVMFAVDDIDSRPCPPAPPRGRAHWRNGQYEDQYRLCYIRGPEGIIVGLAEQLT